MWAERLRPQSYGVSKDIDLDIMELAEWVYMSKSLPEKRRGEELRTSSLISDSHSWLLTRGGVLQHGSDGSTRVIEELERCAGFSCQVATSVHVAGGGFVAAYTFLLLSCPLCPELYCVNHIVQCRQQWNSHSLVSFREALLWMNLIHTDKTYSSCCWFRNSLAFCFIIAPESLEGKLQLVLKIGLFQH